jgi:hypothetical protein
MQRYPFPGNSPSTVPPTERRRDQILIRIPDFRVQIQILVIASVTGRKSASAPDESAGREKRGKRQYKQARRQSMHSITGHHMHKNRLNGESILLFRTLFSFLQLSSLFSAKGETEGHVLSF